MKVSFITPFDAKDINNSREMYRAQTARIKEENVRIKEERELNGE